MEPFLRKASRRPWSKFAVMDVILKLFRPPSSPDMHFAICETDRDNLWLPLLKAQP